jgi:hypothetical protein
VVVPLQHSNEELCMHDSPLLGGFFGLLKIHWVERIGGTRNGAKQIFEPRTSLKVPAAA